MNETAVAMVLLSLAIVAIFVMGIIAYYLNRLTGCFDTLLSMTKKEMNPV